MNNRRLFGNTQIDLSPITLGTMRFSSDRFESQKQAVALLDYLYDKGIDTYHTSHEYDTHGYFCDTFRQFKEKNPGTQTFHIVKLACPHFEEIDFSLCRLERHIDGQLKALSIEQIDIVQWLFRQKNNIDEIRIPALKDSAQSISESLTKLVQSGKVRSFASFPYTTTFADTLNQYNIVDGFVDYLNIKERSWSKKLQESTMKDQGFIAIRPLMAGKVLDSDTNKNNLFPVDLQIMIEKYGLAHGALCYPLMHPKVTSIILSISTVSQANTAAKVAENCSPAGDLDSFINITTSLDNIDSIN